MMNVGKCPNTACGKVLTYINFETVKVREKLQERWKGVTYLCPHCHTILGAEIDPVALMGDTIKGVVKELKGK
jgi:hypothetical protein